MSAKLFSSVDYRFLGRNIRAIKMLMLVSLFLYQRHKSDKERYAEMILKSKNYKVWILTSLCH